MDEELERFVDETWKRPRKDLKLTVEELREYFKMYPRVSDGPAYKEEFKRFVRHWKQQKRRCVTGSTSWIYYHPRDELGRATGAVGCLQRDAIKRTGRRAPRSDKDTDIVGSDTVRDGRYDAPGYEGGQGLTRGHLIGRDLGGSGKELRNLVPQYQNPNSGAQRVFEGRVAKKIASGERIYYLSVPSYSGSNLIPYKITLYAVGNRGTKWKKEISNTPNGR